MDATTPKDHQQPRNDTQQPEPQSTKCREYTDRFFCDTFKENDIERSLLERFLQDSEEDIPSWSTDVITDFCCSNEDSEPVRSPEIKLNDCEHGTNKSRSYPEVLSRVQAHQSLSVGRFCETNKPNADRRKLRINNIDPESLRIVAETAHCHQVEPLRDAFSKHISYKTSLKVVEPPDGFLRTRLELNIPYLALRTVPKRHCHQLLGAGNSPLSPWSEFPFLTRNTLVEHGSKQSVRVIYRGHISIMMCHWDDTKWTAYGLSKPVPGGENGDEDDDDDDDDDEDELVLRSDILAPDGPYCDLENIWNFKIYFLRIAAMWITLVWKEYERLVRTLEDGEQDWEMGTRHLGANNIREQLDITTATMKLLRRIKKQMCPAIRAWTAFFEPGGGIEFFKDLEDRGSIVSLRDIKHALSELIELEHALLFMSSSWQESAAILNLQLVSESKDLVHQTHRLHERTSLINDDIQKLQRKSTNAAENTTLITRLNVVVILITTPFILALQYFGTEKPIFTKFDRSPKNFFIALCVLGSALPLLTYIFTRLDIAQKRFFAKKKKNITGVDATEDLTVP
ncbi:hypothetical protein IQ07DRAFT_588578 [Pyrenochaeta sp. DS3sAY3a]|nr:hypothetical protein IQ07DRAFT_588578 [Pyrenochaeta sp. DS3sAY3a]